MLQLMKAGDIEFCISASANAATLSPQAGVMSLHFLFRVRGPSGERDGRSRGRQAVREMIDDTVQGGHVLAVITLGMRNMYSKKEIKKVDDIKGVKVRVQATPTEDTMFPAYGAQPCTCRSATSTPRCRPAWSTPPRTASTCTW